MTNTADEAQAVVEQADDFPTAAKAVADQLAVTRREADEIEKACGHPSIEECGSSCRCGFDAKRLRDAADRLESRARERGLIS